MNTLSAPQQSECKITRVVNPLYLGNCCVKTGPARGDVLREGFPVTDSQSAKMNIHFL